MTSEERPMLDLPFVWHDGGRRAAGHHGHTTDCLVRAIAITSGRPYQEIYDILGTDRVDTHCQQFRDQMAAWGFVRHPCMGLEQESQIHLTSGELPNTGRLVILISSHGDCIVHATALIDGTIYDAYNPQQHRPNLTDRRIKAVYQWSAPMSFAVQ